MRIFSRLRLARLAALLLAVALCAWVAALGQTVPQPPLHAAPPPALPALAGWVAKPAQFAPARASGLPAPAGAIMAEYGLQSVERVHLTRGGAALAVEALYFRDPAGAFGAFTYYDAAATGTLHVYPLGRWLLRIESTLAPAALHTAIAPWAHALSDGVSEAELAPSVAALLPLAHRLPNSLRYAEGPVAFSAFCNWLPATAVGFDHGAEAALANYAVAGAASAPQAAQMLILAYPTPQMARARLPQLARLAAVEAKRSGPLLVLVRGADAATATALLPKVHYDADVTLTPTVPVGIDALPGLLLGIFVLVGLIMASALIVGVLTGLVRAYLQRTFPGRFDRFGPDSLIQLHLRR